MNPALVILGFWLETTDTIVANATVPWLLCHAAPGIAVIGSFFLGKEYRRRSKS